MKLQAHLLLVTALCALLAGPAAAQGIAVKDAWARATPGGASNGAAYLTLVNQGAEPDRLVSASSPAAGVVELHTHLMEGGVMKMRPVKSFEVKPGSSETLKPGGNHLMLMNLKQGLKEGDALPITLTFEKAGKVEVKAKVQGIGAMGMGGDAGHGHAPAPAQMPHGSKH